MAKTDKGCNANMHVCGLIGAVLMVVGLYSIILGILSQVASGMVLTNWMAMVYYLVGIVLIHSVKMHMCSAHMCN